MAEQKLPKLTTRVRFPSPAPQSFRRPKVISPFQLASGVACENTMRGQKLSKPDMLDGIGYVSPGVVEIMQKQQQGWAYIRP